jgi:hypothetical protein
MKSLLVLFLLGLVLCIDTSRSFAQVQQVVLRDIVIYGGTSAAVIAAVQAKKMNNSVVIVCPDKHLGGLSSGGLGYTDTGNKAVIGGLSRDFYHRVWTHYQSEEAWKWQKKSEYGNVGQGTPAIDGAQRTQWIFEPHVAEAVFESYVKEFGIDVFRDQWLDRDSGVERKEGRIVAIRMEGGLRLEGKVFMDATYEGDLLATAKIPYRVGREANSEFAEEWNGNQVGVLHHRHHFDTIKTRISPYRIPSDPTSGLLPKIGSDPPGNRGEGDKRIQAYCYRMCLTNHDANRIPFPKPLGYDPSQYEILLRVLQAGWRETFQKFDPIPNRKTDTNNHGPFSTDNIGMNYDFPEATYQRRKEISEEHRQYQQGLLYFLSNDPRVPDDVRKAVSEWGLAADEFTDNGNWPHQLYIREARRMHGQFVMTENELLKKKPTPQSIGMGSYTIDSHNVRRYVTSEGYVQNEGDIGVPTNGPYEIALGSILPRKSDCENLIVPVCVSSTHIAFGSIRMEPVFMILGQSASTVASMAIKRNVAVQDVPYEEIRAKLLEEGQIIEYASKVSNTETSKKKLGKLSGIVVDDSEASFSGAWTASSANEPYLGSGYRHNGNKATNDQSATFQASLPASGRYEVRIYYPTNENRSERVPVIIDHAGGTTEVILSQKSPGNIEGVATAVGKFPFETSKPATVTFHCKGTSGFVVVDAVQFLKVD